MNPQPPSSSPTNPPVPSTNLSRSGRAAALGDVPGPHLVRAGRHPRGLHRGGPAGLTAPFADLVLSAKEPVNGADRPQVGAFIEEGRPDLGRSEEHTSELQSLMRISYAVFCLKKKRHKYQTPPWPKTLPHTNTQTNNQNNYHY